MAKSRKAESDLDQQFEDIVQRCLDDMGRVECSQTDYLAALEAAYRRFGEMVQMVRREVGR